ncbi:PREDICTED: fatty acyl-CoA reductase 1-like [Papilio xuthus]|uniref:Fatty acyl-CoA reductase n=1 Tax=Papilio xuthus TaxID=66420 RepID=A0AAJ6ZME1_PAPXU|nr:PREDICTED: fatty acyl-CoA reductase 1-like [Papilio xuthus]
MSELMLALEKEAVNRQHDVANIIASGASSVEKFYSGTNVFVTGGSGFLGKQLLEKLFRCCNVNKVYLLLRAKKGKTAQQRVKEILQDPVFDSLHNRKSKFADNVLAVSGDVSEVKLGLSASDWDLITGQVNIIFHTAATVNFNESMKVVALTNVRGTREILRLAKCCKELRSIVHVSTAYSHATHSRVGRAVKEQFYDSPVPPNAFIDMAETIDESKLENMMQQVKADWPNAYSFSKALGEEIVRSEAENLPISIVRPAIVISSYREPLPGWIDPMNSLGPSGLILGLMTGIIHGTDSSDETDGSSKACEQPLTHNRVYPC